MQDLQLNVWGYHSDLETHTVETHVYRLRKKILATFDDNDFIKSKKNGYQIN
ncbi:helix-turn-helix domain-containing protein [Candidatus Pelagibacter sp.]|nr:helix-turn-helix domain-containing protein [Candidatus Pelagibacter sp.]